MPVKSIATDDGLPVTETATDGGVPVKENDTATVEPTSFVSVVFTDDHSIEGMKVVVRNVTPLQITAAIYYLQRAGNRLADTIEGMQEAKREKERLIVATDIADIARGIQQERGRN